MEVRVDQEKIRELRLRKSWSQEKLADEASVGLRTVQRMELDGTASLKSRLAVANALGVEPVELDLDEHSVVSEQTETDTKPGTGTFLQKLKSAFAYPGPKSVPSKVRTPILVGLWLCMVTIGALMVFISVPLVYAIATQPDAGYETFFIAQIPLLVVFAIVCSVYFLLKKLMPTAN
ncbi:MAG: helix-turn-helix domain-containing protein [Pseudomonadales bacterium]|nr:helix-turn-helix domain-containing protein [Pseudomonadales bacterium]